MAETCFEVLDTLWTATRDGIPGNDDLGAMSSWYVFSALAMYPLLPGRSELMLTTPQFAHATIRRVAGEITIDATNAGADHRFIHSLDVDGQPTSRAWLPASIIEHGGALRYVLSDNPNSGLGCRRRGRAAGLLVERLQKRLAACSRKAIAP